MRAATIAATSVPSPLRRRSAGWIPVYAFLLALPFAALAQPGDAQHLRVELVSEHLALVPGELAQLGLRLRHDPHWHSYWINPGDSGLPTRLSWTLPSGFAAGDIAWPLPQRFKVGGLYNFGYDGEVLLPVRLKVPADLQPGTRVHLAAVAKWLVCREECIPGKTDLALELAVASAPARADPRRVAAFANARRRQPQAAPWSASASIVDQQVRISLRGDDLPDPATLDAFVVQRKLLDHRPPAIRRDRDTLLIEAGRSEYFSTAPASFDLWLTAPDGAGRRGWKLSLPLHAGSGTSMPSIPQQPERSSR